MKGVFVIHVLAAVFIFSCRNTTGNAVKTSDSEPANQSFYFDYILDGREMHIDAADIVSNYYPSKHNTFTIYAGEIDSFLLSLTVSRDIRKPSVTPSVAEDPNMNILTGSVSLQDYPEKNTTCNSYNSASPEATPVIADAIVITRSEKEGDIARIITGSFQAKLYRGSKETQNEYTEHVIKGKFRIRHEFHSYNGGEF
ncbi:MAG: hypothetical protein WKF91_06780 [Segetibacter sp.]